MLGIGNEHTSADIDDDLPVNLSVESILPLFPDMEVDVVAPIEKNKGKARTKIFDPEPERPQVCVYDDKDKQVQLNFRGDELKVSNAYQKERNTRQVSRNRFTNGLQRSAYKMKLVTNDDVFLGFRSAEKNTSTFFSTNVNFKYVAGTGTVTVTVVPTTETDTGTEGAAVVPALSFLDLARMSPSKSLGKPTARTLKRDKVCSNCGIIYDSADDKQIESAWIGCDGIKNGQDCPYWTHMCCIGFVDARTEDFENLTFYCKEHNNYVQVIDKLKEKREMSQKRRKSKKVR